jgi:hypothetical protein
VWRIAASVLDPDRTQVRSLVTGRVRADGEDVEGDAAGGFAVTVSRDCRITLVLRAATRNEL